MSINKNFDQSSGFPGLFTLTLTLALTIAPRLQFLFFRLLGPNGLVSRVSSGPIISHADDHVPGN